jgi:hypothetical protein
MAEANYEIVGSGTVWIFEYGGEESPAYPSAQAAFEAAVEAASEDVRNGLDVTIRLSRTANPGDSLASGKVEDVAPETKPLMIG